MTNATFRFSTDILRRLGEELNPSLDQSVIELAKNAHDADANYCTISLADVTSAGGSLTITDDGDGMTVEEIKNNFLMLGKSPKFGRTLTRQGRKIAGSKGLGRLAALRSGTQVTVRTRSCRAPGLEHELRIAWTDFDNADAVDAVPLEIKESSSSVGVASGTTIEISGLSRGVTRKEVHQLARALLLLADPFADNQGSFRPTLASREFDDLAELVERKYFDDAEYHLISNVNEDGIASAQVVDWRGEVLYKVDHSGLRRGNESIYSCPPADFDLWVFILNRETFQTRSSNIKDVRTWLREFGGVMLYLNDIRVPPYGDAENDWLDMNLRRTRSPEERPGTNTSLGRIRVTDEQSILKFKTDRSGIIDTQAFADLKLFAQDALDWMARERLQVAETRRQRRREKAPMQTQKSIQSVKQIIETASAGEPELKQAFEQYERARNHEERALREEVQLYRTLSTAGITAATFAHEASGGPLKIIIRAVSAVRRRIADLINPIPGSINEPLDSIKSSVSSLGAFSDTTLGLVDREKRRAGRVEVHFALRKVIETYRPFLKARDTTIYLDLAEGSPYLRSSIAAIESVIVNLLTNSLVALMQSSASERRIEISTLISFEILEVIFADNGTGIVDFSASEIWLPGVTSRLGGSGLGLTIVRDTIADLGGDIEAIPEGRLGGAEFKMLLPIIGG